MSFLLDTNVLSEVRKGARCDRNVAAWYSSLSDEDAYISVLTLGEIRRGIDMLQRRDARQAMALQQWLNRINGEFADRVVAVDRVVADAWGRLTARRTMPPIDALLAATAIVHDMTLATRNEVDFAGTDVPVTNPYRFAGDPG